MTTKVNCLAIDCIFNEAEQYTSAEIIYDPAEGCLTYEAVEEDVFELDEAEEAWDEEDLLLEDENEDLTEAEKELWLENDDKELDENPAEDDW